MSVLTIPPLDAKPWPTLGPAVYQWMLEHLVYGPGDLRGVPLTEHEPDDEFKALVYRAYEVYPREHPRAGRRRFRRVAWSLRKGTGKSEKAAWIAAAELHPDAPVRCDGWTRCLRDFAEGLKDEIPPEHYEEEMRIIEINRQAADRDLELRPICVAVLEGRE